MQYLLPEYVKYVNNQEKDVTNVRARVKDVYFIMVLFEIRHNKASNFSDTNAFKKGV